MFTLQTGDEFKPTKQEKQIATYVRFNCATKTANVQGDEVHYFSGARAVDCLMKSKWSAERMKTDPVITTRASAVEFMQRLLDKGMCWRARKLVAKLKSKEDEQAVKKKKTKSTDAESKAACTSDKAAAKEADEDDDEKSKKKKAARKVKLEFHADQVFRDDKDVYAWHFDPISWTKFFIGLALGGLFLPLTVTSCSVRLGRRVPFPAVAELAASGRLLPVAGRHGPHRRAVRPGRA